jgi:hypothetical protein
MPSIGISARGTSTAGNTSRRQALQNHHSDVRRAENRLRMIEQISKYREDKIKMEFLKLEEDLRVEDEKQKEQYKREVRLKKYHAEQKQKLLDY